MNASGDPFYVVRAEVQHSMSKIQDAYADWIKLAHADGTTAVASDLELKTSALLGTLRSVEWDLQDLDETVRVVESNPARFNVSALEAQERREFVSEMQSQAAKIKKHVGSTEVKNKIDRARRNAKLQQSASHQAPAARSGSSGSVKTGAGFTGPSVLSAAPSSSKNDDFVRNEALQQDLIMQEQDVELGELGKSVKRIGNMGKEMHLELSRQGEILDDIDTEMDSTLSRFRAVQQKLNKMIEETSKGQMCTIILLTVALVVLTMLVILT
ncbi:Syntaxin-61 [Porphyridium purpureum]|uniref:Syntaxin-61 n=1 Tax=Porphyridium purpureum TaxID=35688 RepID=A0A5J4YZT5_PORPP|nr:Syntaxin-61 [Porphyridium purpureum]|eukprot:POR6979..scf209_3